MSEKNQAAGGETQLSLAQRMSAKYLEALGPRGPVLFAEGFTFEDATEIVTAELNEQIRRKDEQIQALKAQSDDTPAELKGGSNRRQL